MDNAEYSALIAERNALRAALDFACKELEALIHRADTRGGYTRRQLVNLSTEAAVRQGRKLLHKWHCESPFEFKGRHGMACGRCVVVAL